MCVHDDMHFVFYMTTCMHVHVGCSHVVMCAALFEKMVSRYVHVCCV